MELTLNSLPQGVVPMDVNVVQRSNSHPTQNHSHNRDRVYRKPVGQPARRNTGPEGGAEVEIQSNGQKLEGDGTYPHSGVNFTTDRSNEPAGRIPAENPTVAPKIPDGGLNAWLQVVGSFFWWFNSWYGNQSVHIFLKGISEDFQ